MNILIDKGLFSDVTLAVAGTEFKAHKAILAGTCDIRFANLTSHRI